MAVFGTIAWFVYLSIAWKGCHGGEFVMFNAKTGGAASRTSLLVAALLGAALLLLEAVAGFRLRPNAWYLLASFLLLYVVA